MHEQQHLVIDVDESLDVDDTLKELSQEPVESNEDAGERTAWVEGTQDDGPEATQNSHNSQNSADEHEGAKSPGGGGSMVDGSRAGGGLLETQHYVENHGTPYMVAFPVALQSQSGDGGAREEGPEEILDNETPVCPDRQPDTETLLAANLPEATQESVDVAPEPWKPPLSAFGLPITAFYSKRQVLDEDGDLVIDAKPAVQFFPWIPPKSKNLSSDGPPPVAQDCVVLRTKCGCGGVYKIKLPRDQLLRAINCIPNCSKVGR